jgi:hypothetical protein
MSRSDLSHPFANFLYSFGPARKLLERAYERGSLIEGIVLYVTMIDGLLRASIVLDKQLAGDPIGDIEDYIQQVTGGPKFTEKMIYTEAHTRNLIDDDLRDEIITLLRPAERRHLPLLSRRHDVCVFGPAAGPL